ncbi:PREDICTED: small EDRK-rich factor 1-like [Chrysochloris asiatica]|uniref:Small EDRK-rich factor 1-like n=1 Tax=Chrysochloris asiatica TaxID=185453 RepID=A0A9B0TRD0_CHRAS|nr:PREDICTED: small EDRK-rich factor 1-like [Chrysochloris asiatica]
MQKTPWENRSLTLPASGGSKQNLAYGSIAPVSASLFTGLSQLPDHRVGGEPLV